MESKFSASIDPLEIEKFSKMAQSWWDENGDFKPLHQINPIRIDFIRNKIIEHFKLSDNFEPLKGLDLLDIGCGGGLLCEPMRRLGANVTGIDASEKNIKIAKLHSEGMNFYISYICATAENLAASNKKFDVILNMEVIEHVADLNSFISASSSLMKPGAIMFISTINKTLKSLLQAKIAAEYILRWLPIGTHDWNKFLTPAQIAELLRKNNINIKEIIGMKFNIIKQTWYLDKNIDVNYIMVCNN